MVRSFPWQRNPRNAHPCRCRHWSGDFMPEPGTDGAATAMRPAALGLREGTNGSWRLRFRERGELKTTGLPDHLARRHDTLADRTTVDQRMLFYRSGLIVSNGRALIQEQDLNSFLRTACGPLVSGAERLRVPVLGVPDVNEVETSDRLKPGLQRGAMGALVGVPPSGGLVRRSAQPHHVSPLIGSP